MFLPGTSCTCCGGGNCLPCQYCAPSCLEVSFSGFSHGGESCGECDYLEDTTFIIKRPPVASASVGVSAVDADGPDANTTANGSGATFGTVGINSQGQMTNMARRPDGSYYVTAVPITNGGSNYDSPTLSFTQTGFIQCRPATASATVVNGVITQVAVQDGGEYWPANSCGYSNASDAVCKVCPGDFTNLRQLWVAVSVGATSNSVTLYLRSWHPPNFVPRFTDTAIVSATQSSIDADGNRMPCDDFTFAAESVTLGCATNGTITLSSADCDSESVGYCEGEGNMPEQITLSLSGMGNLFVWASQNGGAPQMGRPCIVDEGPPVTYGPYEPFCGQCGDATHDIFIRAGGSGAGIAGYSGSLVIQDFQVVLDRDERPDCFWSWSGYAPAPPSESARANTAVFVDCGGDLTVPVSVSIVPVGLETTVFIDGPTKAAGLAATAEASVSSPAAGGAITGVTLLTPGSGYAREIFARSQPEVTATVGGGSGAVLSVALMQLGTGESAYWYVSSVSVINGGTGYYDFQPVGFTPEPGAVTAWDAYGFVFVGRVEPTVTASVAGGSGAVLSVTLAQDTGEWGRAVWRVASVAVVSGGTGYTDGDPVTFTAIDGIAAYNASATISVTDGVITAVNITEYCDWWGCVFDNGEYYKSTGAIVDVLIESQGAYYKESPTGMSEVDTPTVLFSSRTGSGATATATVDGSVGSPTFGQITGITVTNGGTGYRAAGTGWLLTINAGVNHLQTLVGNEKPPSPNAQDPLHCNNFWNKNLPIAGRVSLEPCPSDLLSRTYTMSAGTYFSPFGDPAGDGLEDAIRCRTPGIFDPWLGVQSYSHTFFDFGNGPITCTISPG